MKINKYPDGTSYAEVEWGDHPHITFRINSYQHLWQLNQIVDAYNNKGISPSITIPNLIDAQADRRFADNQSSGLKLVCKFLNNMDAKFYIFHPHNPEIVEAMMDNVTIVDNYTFINDIISDLIADKFGKDYDHFQRDAFVNNTILMSSDAGGFKPLMKLADKIGWRGETFSAAKSRSWDDKEGTKFVQQINRDNFEGKDILIIDDISIYGGTFKGLAKLLRERNVGNLYLAVSHMTVQELGKDPVTDYYDKVFTTNSKFDKYYTFENTENRYGDPNFIEPKNLIIKDKFIL